MQYQHQLGQETDDLPVLGAGVQWGHAPYCFVTHMHQKKKPIEFSDTRSLHEHTTYDTEVHRT